MKVKFALTLLLCCVHLTNHAQLCSTSSPKFSQLVTNSTATGSIGWSGLDNVTTTGHSYASAGTLLGVLASANSNFLVLKNFDFAIPPGAGICGIEVTRVASVDGLLIGSSVRDNDIRIVKNNLITGSQHATGVNWPSANASETWGGSNDDWGTGWTAEDINSPGFGLAISVRMSAGLASLFLTAKVESVTITVYYNLVLPLKAPKFHAEAVGERVKLEWTTAVDDNSSYFLVQRSTTMQDWELLQKVPGKKSAGLEQIYRVYDDAPLSENRYRVLGVAADGQVVQTSVVTISMVFGLTAVKVYPNPGREIFFVRGDNITEIEIRRIDGLMVPIKKSRLSPDTWRIQLLCAPGVYMLRAAGKKGVELRQILVR